MDTTAEGHGERRCWKVSTGSGTDLWSQFQVHQVIAFGGWTDLRKLGAADEASFGVALAPKVRQAKPNANLDYHAKMNWYLLKEMRQGDLVCAYKGKTVLGWGEVVGDYDWDESLVTDYPQIRRVEWKSVEPVPASRLPEALSAKLRGYDVIIPLTAEEFRAIQNAPRGETGQHLGGGPTGEPPNVWWVFHSGTFQQALQERYLWAPAKTDGRSEPLHWAHMNQVNPGDVIVHYTDSRIVGLGRATASAMIRSHPGGKREDKGYHLSVEVWEMQDPVDVTTELRTAIVQLHIEHGPITRDLSGKQGYLWCFSQEGLQLVRDLSDEDWPDWAMRALPAATAGDNGDLLSLIASSMARAGLRFTDWQIASFYTALQTKGFVILSGISGTGKTKLAQHFTALLPQPALSVTPPDDVIAVTVQPYMSKYNRIIIPKDGTRLFEPPEPGDKIEVAVHFDEQTLNCQFVHAAYSGTDYLSLLLKASARQWFAANFEPGETVVIEPLLDDDQQLRGFRLAKLEDMAEAEPEGSMGRNELFLPVRPDWRDSKSLLGYFNPLTGTYQWTEFLRFVLRARKSFEERDGLAWFVILDEMNLAHVEYYFADLLSVLESGRDDDGWTREALRFEYPAEAAGDLPPRELALPGNLYIVGTVNVDETTHAFSPKVLDRAFTIELTEADFVGYPPAPQASDASLGAPQRAALLYQFGRDGLFVQIEKSTVRRFVSGHPSVAEDLQLLNERLRPFDMHFGYRVFDEIVCFLASAEANGVFESVGEEGDWLTAAFDAAVLMKVLPKFHGSRSRLEEPLAAVLAFCVSRDHDTGEILKIIGKDGPVAEVVEGLAQGHYRLPQTAHRAVRMVRSLLTDGFAAFG